MKIIEKLNKKSGAYCLSAVAKSRDFAFIIDGSLAVNENSASVKWYVANLKMALKKFLLKEEVLPALSKACQYVDERFKKYFEEKTPYVGLGICRKWQGELQILLFNNVRCYLKTKEVKVLEDQKVKRDKNLLLKQMKEKTKKVDFPPIYAKLDDQEKYLYYKIPYEEAYAALLCNGPLQHYQDYLELTDTAFFTLISEQGIKYCYTHLRRIEEKDPNMEKLTRFKFIDDVVALYVQLL